MDKDKLKLACKKFIENKIKPSDIFHGLSILEIKYCVNSLSQSYNSNLILTTLQNQFDDSREYNLLVLNLYKQTKSYWYLHLFIKNKKKSIALQKLIFYIFNLYPNNVNNFLLFKLISPDIFLSKFYQIVWPLNKLILNSPSWGGIELAKQLYAIGKYDLALEITSAEIYCKANSSLRLEALRIRFDISKTLNIKSNNFEKNSPLSIAVTIAYINPDYGYVTEILNNIISNKALSDPIEIIKNKKIFSESQSYIINAGAEIDVGLKIIHNLVMKEWLYPEEILRLIKFKYPDTPLPIKEECIFPEENYIINPPYLWNKFNSIQPKTYQLPSSNTNGKRAELVMGKFIKVRFLKKTAAVLQASTGEVYRNYSFGRANFYSFRIPSSIIFCPGKTALISPGYGDSNYCHFLLDRLPLVDTILKEIKSLNAIIIDKPSSGRLKEFLYLKNIDIEIISLQKDQAYEFEELYTFNSTQHPCQHFPNEYINFYKSLCLPSKVNSLRVFIKRPKGRRGIVNSAEISLILKKYNFIEVELEKMTINEQIQLFYQANFIIGCHGAGLSNLVFSKPSTKVIELAHCGYLIPTYFILANRLNLIHSILLDENVNYANNPMNKFLDLEVNPEKLISLIESLDSLS